MKRPTLEEQRALGRKREETERILERMRREKLRGMPYNWRDVDAIVSLGDSYDGPPRTSSALEEQQRLFMILRERMLQRAPGHDPSDRSATDPSENSKEDCP